MSTRPHSDSSEAMIKYETIYSKNHEKKRLQKCKRIQIFYKKFKDHEYLYQLSGTQLKGEGKGLPCPLLKIEKKGPYFRGKNPDCVHIWFKFFIQNAVLRVSSRKFSMREISLVRFR